MKQLSNKNSIVNRLSKLLISFLCLVQLLHGFQFAPLVVTASTQTIGQLSIYTINYLRQFDSGFTPTPYTTTPILTSATITITFPSQYSLAATSSQIVCMVMINSGQINQRSCSITGNQIVINGAFTQPSTIVANLTLTITNILNPVPAITTSDFVGSIGSDTSARGGNNNYVILQAATFQQCKIKFNPTTVNSSSSMILTITPSVNIPTTGQIIIQFANNRWTNDISTTTVLPITSSMACTAISSNVQNTVSCSGNTGFAQITVNNLFASGNLNQFQFRVQNFWSPPTNQPSDAITIYSQVALGKLDNCVTYVTGLTPKAITSFTITDISSAPLTVNRIYTAKFTFTVVDTITGTDYFTIQFPSDSIFNYDSLLLSGSPRYNQTTSSFGTSNKVLTIYMRDTNRITYSGGIVTINIGNYTAPSSITPTSNFVVTVLRNGYPLMTGSASLTANPSTLSGSVAISDNKVNSNTSYTFSITTSDPITSAGKIKIKMPPRVRILTTSTNCATVSGSRLSTNPICTVNSTDNSITLTQINSTGSNILAQTFTVKIQGLQNPPSTTISQNFNVFTYYSNADSTLVAQGTLSGITATTAVIDPSQVTITPSGFIVNQNTVTYTFQLAVTNQIPIGGYFLIYVPSEVKVDYASIAGLCSINIGGTSFQTTSCTASVHNTTYSVINFNNPFTTYINKGNYFIARIQTVFKNPISTAPTPSFQIATFWSDGSSIAQITSALSVKMNTADSFSSMTIIRQSQKNNEMNKYTFNLIQRSPMQLQSQISITFPLNIYPVIPPNPTCDLLTPSAVTGINCDLTASTLKITLPISAGIIATNTQVSISVTRIKNPPSFQQPGSFIFQSKTANNFYSYSYGIFTNLTMRNTIPTTFQSVAGVFTPATLGSPIKLQVTVNPSNSGVVPTSLQLTLGNSFTTTTLTCNAFDDIINGQCTQLTSHTIQIKGTFVASQMNFSVQGFSSPLIAPTGYSSIVSFDANGNKLDQSTSDILFVPACTLPCQTCVTNTPTVCLSCYQNTNISPKIYYDTVTQNCYQQCPDGKYENTVTKQCTNCNTNCQTCQTASTFCETCKQDTDFKYLRIDSPTQQICVSACPQKMYPDTAINPPTCVNCVTPCITCTGLTQCLTCDTGFFMLSSSCITSCPVGQYIQNVGTNICDPCNASCKTCNLVITNCTSCTSPLIFYQSQCLVTCPSPLVNKAGTCQSCDSPCKTCSLVSTNCTSCLSASPTPYLHQNLCLGICPDNYYENIGLGQCSLCSSIINLNCNNCTTSSTCGSCNAGFVLHNQQCLPATPSGFVNISGIAVPCTGDCETCSLAVSNCTSCKTLYLTGNQCLTDCPVGFIGINKICIACQSPCRTCQTTPTTCLSCLTTLNPSVFYINNQCLQTCPDGTYTKTSPNICENCISPCQYCTAQSTCKTCLNGFFLNSTSCIQQCDPGLVGINRLCTPCLGNCASCENSTKLCTSCTSGTYLFALNNSCLSTCGQGLFVNPITQTCVYCTQPCNTCVTTPTNCLSCLTGILYNNGCQNQCPSSYFNQSGICTLCPARCSSCTSLTTCLTCLSPYLLYNSFCISQCPLTHSVVINQQCTPCTDSFCRQCTTADVCTMCDSDYNLLTGTCLNQCPVLYETNGTHCNEINTDILTSDTSSFPVPFSIAAVVFIIACLMSKLQFAHTFLPGAIFALISLLEWGALVYFLYLYYIHKFTEQNMPLFVGLGALAYLYLLNLLGAIGQNYIVCRDKLFSQWNEGSNKCSVSLVNILAILMSHKFRNILFCKLFTFSMFSAYLENTSKFKIFNIFSFLSLIHSGGAIFAASIALSVAETSTQLYYQCIDVIVVTALNVLLAFFNVLKSKDFFYERTPDGFDLNKKIKVDDELIQKNIRPTGNDQQEQVGHLSSFMHATKSNFGRSDGFGTTKPFKMTSKANKQEQISQQSDFSYGSLLEGEKQVGRRNLIEQKAVGRNNPIQDKQYNQISIQAFEIINDKFDSTRGLDFTAIQQAGNHENNSNYTVFFANSDKNIQNTIDPSYTEIGIQNSMDKGPSISNKSIQLSVKVPVNQSVQKYNSIDVVNQSAQRSYHNGINQSAQNSFQMNGVDRQVQKSKSSVGINQSVQGSNAFRRGVDQSVQGSNAFGGGVDQSVQKSHTHKGVDQSIQGSNANGGIDQSIQKYDAHDAVDRSMQHTIFYNDNSVQYGSSMKSKKPSMYNKSIQQSQQKQQKKSVYSKGIMMQPSVRNQSNQKSTIQKQEYGAQGSIFQQQQKSLQAIPQNSDRSVQITRKSYKDQSIQNKQSITNKSIQVQNQMQNYKQFGSQQLAPSKQEQSNVIFQSKYQQDQQNNNNKQLKQANKDQLILPKQQIKTYEEELEDRIRTREKQLQKLRRKVQIKEKGMDIREKSMMMRKKQPLFIQQSGKLHNKGEHSSSNQQDNDDSVDKNTKQILRNNSVTSKQQKLNDKIHRNQLKKQARIVESEDSSGVQRTIQEISVINDESQKNKIKASIQQEQKQEDSNQHPDDKYMGMLDNREDQILYEDSEDQDQQKKQKQQEELTGRNQPVLKDHDNSDKINSAENVSNQYEGKDGRSTNIYSSSKKPRDNKNDRKGALLDMKHIDKSIYEGDSSDFTMINPVNVRSDMSGTIQEIHGNLNRTVEEPTSHYNHTNQSKSKGKERKIPEQNNSKNQYDYRKNAQQNSESNNRSSQEKINQKVKASIPTHTIRPKRALPEEKGDDMAQIPHRKFTYNNLPENNKISPSKMINENTKDNPKHHERKSSLLLAGQSQFSGRNNNTGGHQQMLHRKKSSNVDPMKIPKRWQFSQQDKHLSQSGEQQIKNTRTNKMNINKLDRAPPFETDKEETSFRNVSYLGSQKIMEGKNNSNSKIGTPTKFHQHRDTYRSNAIINNMEQQAPGKPNFKYEREFGTDGYQQQYSDSRYIQQDSSLSSSPARQRNNIILNQLLDRPDNDLQDYYNQGNRKSNTKQRSKNKNNRSNSNSRKDTQKIYMQRFDKSKR